MTISLVALDAKANCKFRIVNSLFLSILTSCYDGTIQLQTVDKADPIFTLSLEEQPKVVEWIKIGELSFKTFSLCIFICRSDWRR